MGMQQVDELLLALRDINVTNSIQDKVWWRHDNKGQYTVKSFSKAFCINTS